MSIHINLGALPVLLRVVCVTPYSGGQFGWGLASGTTRVRDHNPVPVYRNCGCGHQEGSKDSYEDWKERVGLAGGTFDYYSPLEVNLLSMVGSCNNLQEYSVGQWETVDVL